METLCMNLVMVSLAVLVFPQSATCQDKSQEKGLIREIERSVLHNGRKEGTTWFHPRACLLPSGHVFMTLQSISGSDVFGHVHWTESSDGGKSWSNYQKIPEMGRKLRSGNIEEGVCDVVPDYHPQTGTILAMGHNVYYGPNKKLLQPQLVRFPVYQVRDPKGQWSNLKPMIWDDPRGEQIFTCGCGQKLILDNGDLLIPISFAAKGVTDRAVTTLLCSFDGKEVKVKKAGTTLENNKGRGLLEPSLALWNGRYYMTMRAEDNRGYVSTSPDGLTWNAPIPWKWDDGEPLTMSTTQQHWITHSDALFLVYTRKAEENAKVFRWRAPLYIAQFDPKKLCLIRESEQIVLPMIGDGLKQPDQVARMGNFHTTNVTPAESWVTVGETLPGADWRGDLLLAKIRWTRPNRLVGGN